MNWEIGTDIHTLLCIKWASQGGAAVKNPPANTGDARDTGLIPASGRSHGERNGNLC